MITGLLKESLKTEKKELIKAHIPTIVRYAYEVPFDDIRTTFKQLLETNEVKNSVWSGASTNPRQSFFIPKSLFPPINTNEPTIRAMYQQMFLQDGRVSHLHRVLGLHSTYFERYFSLYNYIMKDSTCPLPIDWRNYIAILSAARHQCAYLVKLSELEFLLNGGDPSWLQGVERLPRKLGNLLEVNALLCHQPWLITKDHIASLSRGEDAWSIGELVHAMVIICTLGGLSRIVFGCGVTPEVDLSEMTDIRSKIYASTEEFEEEEAPTSQIADTKKIAELLKQWKAEETQEQQQEQLFATAETEGMPEEQPSESTYDMFRYIGKFKIRHEDFNVRSKEYNIFRVQDYCWSEHGFELVRQYFPDAATLLDEEFTHIYELTYNKFNKESNVDTFPFRRAIWQYVQRIKGMFHDDYDYREVNLFLNRATKTYIKKITCAPQTIKKSDFTNIGYELTPDEKVHIALLSIESAKQSELLYGLYAVMLTHFFKNTS